MTKDEVKRLKPGTVIQNVPTGEHFSVERVKRNGTIVATKMMCFRWEEETGAWAEHSVAPQLATPSDTKEE